MNGHKHMVFLAAFALGGCFYRIENKCQEVRLTGSETRGDLVGVESEDAAAALPDYPRLRSVTTNGVVREVMKAAGDFEENGAAIDVALGTLDLRFDKPSAPGPTTLAALHAQLCEWQMSTAGPSCHPVDGAVDVAVVHEPCGDGVCGALDVTLRVAQPDPLPRDAVVYGSARLLHREWKEQACHMEHEGSDSAFAVEL